MLNANKEDTDAKQPSSTHLSSQYSRRPTSSTHIHIANERPCVRLRVILLHTSQAVGAIEAPNEIDLVVHDGS